MDMPKSLKLEALQEQLTRIRNDPDAAGSEETIAQLRSILQSRYAIAVAQAAKLVGKLELFSLQPDLVAAFDRGLVKPVETDPNCHAKAAIAEALYRLSASQADLFLQGIHHIQREPVWGGQVDTAAKLRGICAMGLVRMNYPDVLTELADLLADPEAPARIAAARAIAYSENDQGVPLLRLRLLAGDEPTVLSECVAALLKLAPQKSLELAMRFLRADEMQTQELVALALGESRLPEALEGLIAWWQKQADPELRQTGLLAIAMLRTEAALDFLIGLIANGRLLDAQNAIAALQIYRQDPVLWQRVQAAAAQRPDASSLELED
jgi:HEAT repeat protein